jgi:thiol-disulfide isomerase/thioredoxin
MILLAILLVMFQPAARAFAQTTQPIQGRLVDQNGVPMAGATVCLCDRNLDVYNAAFPTPYPGSEEDHLRFVTTDSKGAFSFSVQPSNYAILVSTDAGYVIAKAKKVAFPLTLKLTPWARVEGTVMLGDKPAPAGIAVETIDLDGDLEDQIGPYLNFNTTTDAAGHYAFPRLPAGPYRIGSPDYVDVRPGVVTRCDILRQGRPVVGRIQLPSGLEGRNFYIDFGDLEMAIELPKMTLPANILGLSEAERDQWTQQWLQSPPGKALDAQIQRKERLSLHFPIQKDGSFSTRIAAGTYALSVYFFPMVSGQPDMDHQITAADYPVVIDAIPGGYSEDPLNVGTLAPQPLDTFQTGQAAPDFAFADMDGRMHRLSDFSGKFVLLDFWGTWCGSCVKDIPTLSAIHDAYRADPRFVCISLDLNDSDAKWRQFAGDHGMHWTQGFLGPTKDSLPAKLYGVTGCPSYFFIGPDGHVVASGWQLEFLRPILAKAMSQSH